MPVNWVGENEVARLRPGLYLRIDSRPDNQANIIIGEHPGCIRIAPAECLFTQVLPGVPMAVATEEHVSGDYGKVACNFLLTLIEVPEGPDAA